MANKYDHDSFLMPLSEKEHDFYVAFLKVLGIMLDRVMIYQFLFSARDWKIYDVATTNFLHLLWFLFKCVPKEQKQPLDISIKNGVQSPYHDPLIVTIAKINCIVFWMERVAMILPFFGIGTWVWYLTSFGFVLSTMIYFANVYAVFIYSKVQVIPKKSAKIKCGTQQNSDENSHEVRCCNCNKMETDKAEHEESEKKEEDESKESHENDRGEELDQEELAEIDSRFDIEMVKARDELGTEMVKGRHELDIMWRETIQHEQRVVQIINNYQRIMDERQSIWERKMKKVENERKELRRTWEEGKTIVEKVRLLISSEH